MNYNTAYNNSKSFYTMAWVGFALSFIQVAKGDLVEALARYNGSRGRLKYPDKVIGAWRKTWRNKTREELPELQASCSNYGLKACRYQ